MLDGVVDHAMPVVNVRVDASQRLLARISLLAPLSCVMCVAALQTCAAAPLLPACIEGAGSQAHVQLTL